MLHDQSRNPELLCLTDHSVLIAPAAVRQIIFRVVIRNILILCSPFVDSQIPQLFQNNLRQLTASRTQFRSIFGIGIINLRSVCPARAIVRVQMNADENIRVLFCRELCPVIQAGRSIYRSPCTGGSFPGQINFDIFIRIQLFL